VNNTRTKKVSFMK